MDKRKNPKATPERLIAGAVMAGAMPGVTRKAAAAAVGVHVTTLNRKGIPRVTDPKLLPSTQLTKRANELADKVKLTAADLGKDLANPAEAQEVAAHVAADVAVSASAEVITRHRREWAVPRNLLYGAIKGAEANGTVETFERLKLAKISAETLAIIHGGERTAHGIKSSEMDAPTVLIDRGEGGA